MQGSDVERVAPDRASARSRLTEAWLRRDTGAMDYLFAYCALSSVRLPEFGVRSEMVRERAMAALDGMRSELNGNGDAAIADGVLAVGLYFHALLGWEGTDDFDKIDVFVGAALDVLDPLTRASPFRSVRAASQMLESVPLQCRTEDARLCACSYSMQLTAEDTVDYLRTVTIAPAGVHDIDDMLLGLIRRDAENTFDYYRLLAKVVAPLAGEFTEVLLDTSGATDEGSLSRPRAALQAEIRARLPEVTRVADELTAAGEVLGGELAVQADALSRMADALDAPSLVLDRGQLVYVYPFTLDEPEPGAGVTSDGQPFELVPGEDPVPLRFQPVRRTDAWQFLAEGAAEVFMEFQDRGELVLADGYELRFRPKWVEMDERRDPLEAGTQYHAFQLRVVLGKHGGHYVHLETQVGERVGAEGPDPWTGAHVDQWVRRLSRDAGADRVTLLYHGEELFSWGTLFEFAEAMVGAIDRIEHPSAHRDESDDEALPDLVGASVIFQVDAARVIEPNGVGRPLRADDHIEQMTGYSALMATARYLPASVEEWVRLDAPLPDNLLGGLRPFGDLLLVNRDVLTLVPLGSPNWVVMEQVEMLEFAISLHGYLVHLSDHLRRDLRGEDDSQSQLTIDQVSRDIRVGNNVLELLRSRGLMRSRYHSELLARIFAAVGAEELDLRADKTVEALRDVRRRLEEEERGRQARGLEFTLACLTVFTGFIAVYGFVGSFFPDRIGTVAQVGVATIAVSLTALLAIPFWYFRRRRREVAAQRVT